MVGSNDALTLAVPEISDVELAFPANALEWMPPMDDIPEEFKKGRTAWNEIVSSWFFNGLPDTVVFHPKEGVDAEAAYRAVKATLGSYAPRHQHKKAAAAFMLSCWFEKIKGWKR